MFSASEIKNVFDVDTALSGEMSRQIELWTEMYSGNAPWLNEDVCSLRLEQGIVREFANTVLTEMTVNVSDNRLNDIFKGSIRNLNENLQTGLATGAMVIKPLGATAVQFIPQNCFIPVEYDSRGRLLKVIFPDIRQTGENEYHIRLEYHKLSENGLEISNRAFKSNSRNTLGKECRLDTVDDWARLPPYIRYPDMKRQAFGYYRNPVSNTIDGSFVGVSVFDSAIGLIYRADKQFGRLDWEFESGERAVHVDESALNLSDGEIRADHTFKRLYRGLNIDASNGDLFKEFSPIIRQEDFSKGLDEYKRLIEFQTCLAYGDLSNPQTVEKTAQEVKTAKKRKYNMINAIQQNLQDCLEDLCYAFAFYNSMTGSGYEFSCCFKDSILADEETERKQDMQDVSIGAMPLWEYRMKWYGEDEETAKAKVSNSSAEVIE